MGDENDIYQVGAYPRVDHLPPISQTTRLSVNGSASIVVVPALPCGLDGCVGELHITFKGQGTNRVHLNVQQRRELIAALGGEVR